MEFAISQPKMVWLPQNEKQTYRLNCRPQMWPSGFTLAMTLTLNFQGQIWNLLLSQPKVVWLPQNEKQTNKLNSRPEMSPMGLEWKGRLTLNKVGRSRSFMIMTVTIWWSRLGVKIYQIVIGVTSDVGMPSTHLVIIFIYGHSLLTCWSWCTNYGTSNDRNKCLNATWEEPVEQSSFPCSPTVKSLI